MHAERIDAVRRARTRRMAGLYAVTPDLDDTAALVDKVLAAVAGGAAVVQYRNKTMDAAGKRVQAHALAAALRPRSALYIVNDDPDLAAEVDADGVHVGADDASIADARARIGYDRLLGVSCYDDFARGRAAVGAGADYVAFGSFFPSASKPRARRAAAELLARVGALEVPVVAIGGITAENAPMLIAAGASAVAVIGGVFAHDSPAAVARSAAAIAACFVASGAVADRGGGR